MGSRTATNPQMGNEYPAKADLQKLFADQPIPVVHPGTVDPASIAGDEPTKQALAVLGKLNSALADDNVEAVADCFFDGQGYWKDALALTYHLRTFFGSRIVAAALLETKKLRDVTGAFALEGPAVFIPATPVLQFIDCRFTFRTGKPAATCSGRLVLLPTKVGGTLSWKIWVLSTKLENLDLHPEDETLLSASVRPVSELATFDTDVLIIGGGNAAIALAARLKALGVESVMAERNPQPGDNWALRYDCLKFHIPTSFCELPYLTYDKDLQSPHLLSRMELAEQVRRYVKKFGLNMINSAKIQSATYDQSANRWAVNFETPAGQRTALCKHLVQATGIGSQKEYLPPVADSHLYKGINVHSARYKNAREFKDRGVKSALVIGSANTAFDVLEDCHAAGLQATMNVRSPTYIVPVDYCCHPMSLGAYDSGVVAADNNFLTLPTAIDAKLAAGLFAMWASQEPDRYADLEKAGFPVLDSRNPECVLMSNLIEKAGGHYVDVGGTKLLADGKCGIKAGTEPVAFTETGLRFSDGSVVETDAVVWCTGFEDKDARVVASEILGDDIAAKLDATWGIDAEGEIRGMWKRHLNVDNYWVMGGYTQQHRWHSRTLALQIKAALAGVLPSAYREVPEVTSA